MAKPTAQQCHALTTHYVSKYNEVVGRSVVVNRNKSRWGFEAMLMDLSMDESKALIEYYLTHYQNPNIEWFLYNYEKVVEEKQDRAEQEKIAEKRREATAKRLEEWRNRWKSQTD